ncbi:prolyl-tRNA synthetase [Candidatus Parcubacteria bacterium]|nr:prolyl-tRNA synthetase [Candidatus Parcubacteria bacterium]
MLQSKLFTKTRKEAPSDEVAKNAQLLIRAGYIDKLQAGVYTYLPLGLRVLKNVERIIRDEMDKAGGQELLMPALQPVENWVTTNRMGDYKDVFYRTDSLYGGESVLGPTHEEVVTPLAKSFISSYRDLPVAVYQIQDKFRQEKRPKSGLLRGREFIMKDLYSFHENEEDLARYYGIMQKAYANVFARAGIGAHTYLTYASGGTFSKYSHEFQAVTPSGEDTIYVCEKCKVAVNKEISADQKTCPSCGSEKLEEKKAIEVGNIFELKTRFSEAFGLTYQDKEGKKLPVVMGCYGIGLGRLMGAVVEVLADERGIIWPKELSPFDVHLLDLGKEGDGISEEAKALYELLQKAGIPVLYDERKGVSAGEKFADSDLIGIPIRAVVSAKAKAAGGIEVKERTGEKARIVSAQEFLKVLEQ